MNRKILKWNFIFQYGWVLTNIFNSILLLPLYLKKIDASTLGVWLATGNVIAWMTLVDPGVGEVLQQRIAEIRGKGQNSETGKLIGSGYIASAFIFILSVVLGILCYLFIGKIINKDIHQYPHLPLALFLTVAATGLTLVSFTVSGINQGLHNSAHVAISSLTANFLFLFVNLFFLYTGWGVLSIAAANLARAAYINIYNMISMSRLLQRENFNIDYDWPHFKRFSKIFSFTSASKIITGLSGSLDMVVLARYLSPATITMFEINRRPVNISYSLIGRHSVALMPVISHAKGSGDKKAILDLINQQFRFYCYAALLASFIFIFNYENLVSAWTGPAQFAGHTIINLLVINFFISLISYFMAIVGYALGDIKMNSLFNIVRNIVFGISVFFAAKYFGIIGTVVVAIGLNLCADLSFYAWRLYKLGYFDPHLWRFLLSRWAIIIPAGFIFEWVLSWAINLALPPASYFARLLTGAGVFTIFFVLLILAVDNGLRMLAKQLVNNTIIPFFYKRAAA